MERNNRLLDLLSTHKTMSTQQLCNLLFCSSSSLRRDLLALEKTGAVRRIRGGAVFVSGTSFEYPTNLRETINTSEKDYICNIASDFLSNGMSLFLDSSTTVARICPILNNLRNITVITNSISTATLLNSCEHIETFITGGVLQKGHSTLLGEPAGDFIKKFKTDLAIISCCSIDVDGVFEAFGEQMSVKKHMIANSKKAILLADSSKFGTNSLHRSCNFSSLQAIISNKQPILEIEEAIEHSGCEMIY